MYVIWQNAIGDFTEGVSIQDCVYSLSEKMKRIGIDKEGLPFVGGNGKEECATRNEDSTIIRHILFYIRFYGIV